MKLYLQIFALSLLTLNPAGAELELFNKIADVHKGPLKISAIETTAKNKGKYIEAKGDVRVHYDMESGDILRSYSQFANYDEVKDIGKIWGNPKAYWTSKDPKQPRIDLKAKSITLKLKQSELIANGNVKVVQASSTLIADEVVFYNNENKMTADGGRPQFTILQEQHQTEIRAEKIIAWSEKKQIHFSERVKGKVRLLSQSKK